MGGRGYHDADHARAMMPTRLPSPCCVPGCAAVSASRYCALHAGGPAYERAGKYGRPWRRLRRIILERDPFCRACNVEPSTQVDHIVSVRRNGNNDLDNLQGLCDSCHGAKTMRELRCGAA